MKHLYDANHNFRKNVAIGKKYILRKNEFEIPKL